MDIPTEDADRRPESKYKIGKVKQIPTVQKDLKTGLSYIELKSNGDEKVYGCTKFAGHYKEKKKLGQGTFGEVYKGVHLETQRQVAMKRIIVNVEKDLFPITAQREITILRRLNHKNVIKLIEMVYDYPPSANHKPGSIADYQQTSGKTPLTKSFYMILPYMVSDLSGILHNPRMKLELGDIKNIMLQLLESINYIHCEKFMHRDIKAANILIDHNGVLKLADFGLARVYYGSPPNLQYPGGAGSGAKYTSVVVTRWYRAPELVLGDKFYTTAVDIWGVGCVFAECFEKKPILQGTTDIDQGHVIFKLLGTPTKDDWPAAELLPGSELTRTNYPGNIEERFGKFLDDTGLDFLRKLLALDPYKRLTAMSAIHHSFFKQEPLPSERLDLPCEESHEADIKRYKEEMQQAMSQKAPTAPRGHISESQNAAVGKDNLPRAPARNAFPKGPASKSTSTNGPRSNTSVPFQRQTSRYSNNSTLPGKPPHNGNNNNVNRNRENSRFGPGGDASGNTFTARLPTGPQPSRFQRNDRRPTIPTSYSGNYGYKDAAYYDRDKPAFKSNGNSSNYQRHDHARLTELPRQPRNDTRVSNYQHQKQVQARARTSTQNQPQTHPLSPNDSNSQTTVHIQDQGKLQSQGMNHESAHGQKTLRHNNTEDNKKKDETRDIADFY